MTQPRLVRGLVVLLTGEGISRFFSFVAIAVLARRLGDANWAPVAVALTLSQFGALFVESGMRLYGAREVARDHSAAGRIAPAVVAFQLVIGVVLVLVAVLSNAFGTVRPDLARLLPGYAVALIALPFFVPWIFQGLSRMDWVAAPQAIRYAVLLLLTFFLVGGPNDVPLLPWLEVASMTTGAAVAMWALRRIGIPFSVAPSRAFDSGILRESIPIAASQLLWVVRMYLPILLLWKLSDEQSVARFDLCHRILMVMQAFLTMYLTNLFTSLSQEAKRSGKRFHQLLFGSTALAATATSLMALVIAVYAGQVLDTLYSDVFNHPEATASLTLLVMLVPVLAIRGHGHYALVALGHQRQEFWCSLVGTAVLVVLLGAWVPQRAAVGAAQAMLVSEVVGLAIIWLTLLPAARARNAGWPQSDR